MSDPEDTEDLFTDSDFEVFEKDVEPPKK